MRYLIIGIIGLIILAGCSPVPPHRSGDYSPKNRDNDKQLGRKDWRRERIKDEGRALDSYEKIELGRVIQSFLGAPYQGHSKHRPGLDCSEFTLEVFMEYDRTKLPRSADEQFREGFSVSRAKMKFGDLVFFRINGREISHVGIYIGFNEFVHSSASNGVMISKINDKYWKKRFAGARHVPNSKK